MRIIAHGIDAVEVERIAAMLREHPTQFAERCFTPHERTYAESGGQLRAQRFAARFACKEAVMKALGTGWTGGVSWQDIEVLREPSGQPRIQLTGSSAQRAAELRIARWFVSITHTQTLAIASVIATE